MRPLPAPITINRRIDTLGAVASARTVAVAVSLAASLVGCSLSVGVDLGRKVPLTATPGQFPGFGAGPTLQAGVRLLNEAHWFTLETTWREHVLLLGGSPIRLQSDPTFLIGYEQRLRLNPEYAAMLVFGGGVGAASDLLCDGFDCVGGYGPSGAAHVGYRFPLNPWLALHATVRARYVGVYSAHSLFLELPIVLNAEF